MEKYLECGKIVNTHGVRGDIKAESWCDSPAVFAALPAIYIKNGQQMKQYIIEKASPFKGMVLCHLAGCDTMEDALRLKNRTVWADRADLPLQEGAHFVADLIGLPVTDGNTGKRLGTLHDVLNYTAQELYEVETPTGMVLVPVVDAFVKSVDPENGIVLTPIDGMLDEAPKGEKQA